MKIEIADGVVETLKKMARQDNCTENDDFMVDDYAGGNIDDAFELGRDSSEIDLARWILSELNISWAE